MSDHTTIFREQLSSSPFLQLFGLLFCLSGFAFLFSSVAVGLLFILIGCLFFVPKRIREVDVKNRKYRQGLSLQGKTTTNWKDLPEKVNYISVMAVKQVYKGSGSVAVTAVSAKNVYKEYTVSLIYNKRKKFKLVSFDSFEEAILMAKSTAGFMEKDIFIVEPGKKRWIRFGEPN